MIAKNVLALKVVLVERCQETLSVRFVLNVQMDGKVHVVKPVSTGILVIRWVKMGLYGPAKNATAATMSIPMPSVLKIFNFNFSI